MLDLDIEQFWKDEEGAHEDNCFSKNTKQVALGIRMSEECVFAELGEEGNPWGYTPRERRLELNKRYNEKALKIVGRSLLPEELPKEEEQLPICKSVPEIFGGFYNFDGNTTWLASNMKTFQDVEKMLDKVDRMDLRSFIFPDNWESEKRRLWEEYGKRPGQFTHLRGPVTMATSLIGAENLIFLIYDEPELAKRWSDTIARVMIDYFKIFVEESGHTMENFDHGFSFSDDDCNLLTPDMYEFFGYPILKKVFDFTAPNPEDWRYQHSDSAMSHLIPILSRLNFTAVNFGPTVTVREIRKHMPRTRIDGQLAPFTFMSNDENRIIDEVKRDCEMAKEDDLRGLNLSTAGSINNGSLLTSMRTVMAAIQRYGRY